MKPDNVAEAERRIEEARRSGQEYLDLGDLGLEVLPEALGELGGLRGLSLSRIRSLEPEGERGLARSRQRAKFSDLSPLARLTRLELLDLGFCSAIVDLQPLAALSNLNSLDLRECSAIGDLQPLAALSNLNSLYLNGCSAIGDLQPLAALSSLNSLKLRGCSAIGDLQPLAALSNLNSLDLRECPAIADLQPLAALSNLNSLDLDGCEGLSSFEPLKGLHELRRLFLGEPNGLTRELLQEILQANPQLERLYCRIAHDVQGEVLSRYPWDNCLPRLRSHFAELAAGAEPDTDVKVLLLGNGKVGKTQLCRRLRGERFDDSIASTHGVQLWRQPLTLSDASGEQTYHVNWWDFGGQDVYHGTHALFLRTRAVFMILWTPHLENQDEAEENGVLLRNQPLAYWLDYVRSLAGEHSPVIVVQSQCERFDQELAPPETLDGWSFYRQCSFGAANNHGLDPLKSNLREAIRFLREQSGETPIGKSRAEVRRRLLAVMEADRKRPAPKRRDRTWTTEQFQALCNEVGGIPAWNHALDHFHHAGLVFYDEKLFQGRIILDQTWALEAIYAVFHRERSLPVLQGYGYFSRRLLEALVWREHSKEEQQLFLSLMQSCGICFEYRQGLDGEVFYRAPDLLPPFEAVEPKLGAWKEDAEILSLRIEYRFLHQGVLREFISKIGQEAGEAAEYWKYGLYLYDRKTDAQLLVREVRAERPKRPGAGAIVLATQGRDPVALLRRVRRALGWHQLGGERVETLSRAGVELPLSVLDGEPRDFLPDTRAELQPASEATTGIEAAPAPDPDPRPKVFISYAWGDDTPEGRERARAVDGLYEALLADGFNPIRDQKEMRPGERISDFMNRLVQADQVVCVISEKYLRSWYCMYEICRIYQRHRDYGNRFAEVIVPVVLPDVAISTAQDRERYIDHWNEQLQRDEATLAKQKLRLAPETYKEMQLVQEFTNSVDHILVFIKNVLMPRNLEAQLQDGFEAVRQVLRRRLPGHGSP